MSHSADVLGWGMSADCESILTLFHLLGVSFLSAPSVESCPAPVLEAVTDQRSPWGNRAMCVPPSLSQMRTLHSWEEGTALAHRQCLMLETDRSPIRQVLSDSCLDP